MSPKVDESRTTCVSLVNMLQRAEGVLKIRDIINDVEEAVADLVELMKAYKTKNKISQVAGTPLFKNRLEDAEAVVNKAFKNMNAIFVVMVLNFRLN